MQSRSATPGLIFEALRVLHDTVGVLSDPERGAAMRAAGTAANFGLVENEGSELEVGV